MGDVEVDRPHMFPCSAVPFALDLHDVAVWHSRSFDDGSGDVLILNRGPEDHFLPWA